MPLSTVIDTWQTETLSDQAKVLESVIECLPDGRWINANALPWRDETGATRGALLVLRDVSDTKRSGEFNERLSNVVEQTAVSEMKENERGNGGGGIDGMYRRRSSTPGGKVESQGRTDHG